MSKYADIEQIKKVIRTEWIKYIPMEFDMNIAFVLGKVAEVPTIEVSEDCISRVETLATLNAMMRVDNDNVNVYSKVFSQIKDAPSVVPSRATGKWVVADDEENIMFTVYRCSECGKTHTTKYHNYCPNCGARMESDTE